MTQVLNPLGAQVGQRVEIQTSSRRFHQALLVLYGVPPPFLLAGAGLGAWVGASLPGDANAWSVLSGVGLFVASLYGIRHVTSGMDEASYRPQIVRVLSRRGP